METEFNYKTANKEEQYFREKGDIRGLIKCSIDFWNNLGSISTFMFRFPMICYYYGRLNELDTLKAFIEEYSDDITIMNSRETVEMGSNLFYIGANYPQLITEEIDYLEKLYSDHKYFEMMDIILFDQHLLNRQLNKFDKTSQEVRNECFSNSLVNEIFVAYIQNLEVEDYDREELNMYNRANNNIVKKIWHKRIPKVEFDILRILNFKKNIEVCKILWGHNFSDYYKEQLLKNRFEEDKFENYGFYLKEYIFFVTSIKEYFKNDMKEQKIEEFKQYVIKDWLTEVNK